MIKPWDYPLDSMNKEILLPNLERKGTCFHCLSSQGSQKAPCPFCGGTGENTQSVKVKLEQYVQSDISFLNRSAVPDSILSSLQRTLFYE